MAVPTIEEELDTLVAAVRRLRAPRLVAAIDARQEIAEEPQALSDAGLAALRPALAAALRGDDLTHFAVAS